MIENYLRQRTTVRSRIMAGSLVLFLALVLSVPVIISNQSFLSRRLQEVTDVEIQAERLLLRASASISASRTNLSRYIQGFTSDAGATLDDTSRAVEALSEAAVLPIDAELKQDIDNVLVELAEYQRRIEEVETNRQSDSGQMIQLEAQTLQLGSDLGVRIDQIIQESANRVESANEAVFSGAQTNLIALLGAYLAISFFSIFMVRRIRQSITNPISDLQEAAERFRQGKWETTVPVAGNDELTSLARTFNQMATDLVNSQTLLEKRVAQRTQTLERSADLSSSLSSILDQDAFSIAVVEQLQSTFGYYYVQLYLSDDKNKGLFLKSATGLPGQKMLIRGHRIQIGQGIVGKAAAARKVIITPDVTQSPDWLENPLLPEAKSEAAVPIISRGTLLGVLDVQHDVLNGISQEESTLLSAIANQIAVALENSRLFEQIQQQASHEALLNRLSQRIQLASSVDQVLQITAQELGKTLNADFVSVELGKKDRSANGREKVR